MIEFKNTDDNKQFISILIIDETPIQKVYDYINNIYPSLKIGFYAMDDEEIIFNLTNNINYGFSLNELREIVKQKAKAIITHFCVDIEEPKQRI